MSGDPRDDFEVLARRYWAAWGDALRDAVPTAGASSGPWGVPQAPPGPQGWQDALDWWTRMAQQGAGAGGGAGPRARAGSGNPADDALAHFNSQARRWYAHMQDVAARFAGQEPSAGDVAQAWKQALGAAGGNPFPEMLRSMRGNGLQGWETWVEGATPWLDALRQEGMSWLKLPAFGAQREQQERQQALAAHMAEYQQANDAYTALMLKAQQQAFAIFEARLAGHQQPGQQIQSGRALFDLWIEAAEEAYADSALSPEFRQVYGQLVNAQMRVRAGVQRMVEDACAQLGMPTRGELDGAHRKLAQLEREVRRLRDAVAAAPASARRDGAAAQARPAAKSAPARPAAKSAETPVSSPAAQATAKRTTRSATKVATKAASKAPTRPARKAATRPATKPAKKAVSKGARKAVTKVAKRTAKKAATKVARKAATRAADKPVTGTAKKSTGRSGSRASAGRSFGGAIAGSVPRAPEPITTTSTKKPVKKGKR